MDGSSLAADSLTNSLQNIETTSSMLEKQPQSLRQDVNNMSLRCSIRSISSGLSALSDVNEDEIEKLNDSDIIGEDDKINNQSANIEEVPVVAQVDKKEDDIPISSVAKERDTHS